MEGKEMEEELTGDGMAKSPSNTDTISQCTHRLQYRNLKIAVIGHYSTFLLGQKFSLDTGC